MAKTFIAQKKVRFRLQNRPADVPAKLIALEWRLRLGNGVECIACVEPVVAQVVIQFAMKCIGARTGGNVYDSA